MKKKINIKSIGYVLMMLTMLLGFSACNNEDDVMDIFNDKTWKLSRITTEKGKEQFYQGLWSNEAEEKASRELLKITENFTLNFNCADVNGEVTGTVSAHAVKANISDAILKIDGKEHTISISGKAYGSARAPPAPAPPRGLSPVFKYATSWQKYSSAACSMFSSTKGTCTTSPSTLKTEIQQKSWDLQPAKFS